MKRFLVLIVLGLPFFALSQPASSGRQYPSLLWEISGKGLKKPSYLFGTMHVSNKLAFQLSDSFYLGIRNADVVALETNPESWQEDMSKYGLGADESDAYRYGSYVQLPDDYLTINTLKFFKYDKKIERSLYSNPSTINNLLYRNYERGNGDFEEDTYLDMYIYQCGKRWGKKVAGVERYGESMKLMAEAYRDAARDKNKKTRSYDRDEAYSMEKLQEAYRTGNLDLLDSINKYNSFSEAFDEKFLYRRNEIQAESIDSILKSKMSLFVGVGAAHLPGERGVIEMLREMGYRLRPIKMRQRDSHHKNSVEKLRVPVKFETQTSDDSLFQVDIPGKFYKFGEDGSLDQHQYADMANGSYYMVTRIMTNAWMFGHTADDVYRTVDSLLYENVPGKIINKTSIQKNGYRGFAITNRTRRGDIQRYQIFVTPFEVIFFKMSGTGEYVSIGDEADRFFNSIKLRQYKSDQSASTSLGRKYSPKFGGFAVSFPHEPYIGNDGSWIYDAHDKTINNRYRVVRTDVHNYSFAGEDSFDLKLLEESFGASDFIKKQISRKKVTFKGYPALDAKYIDQNENIYIVRFIIRGANYFTLIAQGKKENQKMQDFIDSFEFTSLNYGASKQQTDTTLHFTVNTPYYPDESNKLDLPATGFGNSDEDEPETEMEQVKSGIFRSKVIASDSTGERIFISIFSTRRYFYTDDSTWLDKKLEPGFSFDSSRITRSLKASVLPNGFRVWERVMSDSASSRAQMTKTFFRDGVGYRLVTQIDTLSQPSAFIKNFFETFTPVDSLSGSNPFAKKANEFLADFMSTDSVKYKRAVKSIIEVKFDSTNLPQLKKAIASVNWEKKKYLEIKKSIIGKLSDIKSKQASDFLKELYLAAGDTLELQYAALETLLRQKTAYSFALFRDIVINDPPVLAVTNDFSVSRYDYSQGYFGGAGGSNGVFTDELFDSLELTRTILPGILPLINLDDYEFQLTSLLAIMVDSNLVKPAEYQPYLNKFLLEARQSVKKQKIEEKNREIRKAEEAKDDDVNPYRGDDPDPGNEALTRYATLLLPFSKSEPSIDHLIYQILQSKDKELRFQTAILLLRKGRQVHDSILVSLAADEVYRYKLYSSLSEIGQTKKFPSQFLNQPDIARSRLWSARMYDRPDSLILLGKRSVQTSKLNGVVYIFKYKARKDDLAWKIALSGPMPADSLQMIFEEKSTSKKQVSFYPNYYGPSDQSDFTSFTDQKLNDAESLDDQLDKLLKKIIYSTYKSGRQFYDVEREGEYMDYAR